MSFFRGEKKRKKEGGHYRLPLTPQSKTMAKFSSFPNFLLEPQKAVGSKAGSNHN